MVRAPLRTRSAPGTGRDTPEQTASAINLHGGIFLAYTLDKARLGRGVGSGVWSGLEGSRTLPEVARLGWRPNAVAFLARLIASTLLDGGYARCQTTGGLVQSEDTSGSGTSKNAPCVTDLWLRVRHSAATAGSISPGLVSLFPQPSLRSPDAARADGIPLSLDGCSSR